MTTSYWNNVEPWPVTELDRAYGYDAAYAISNASGNILIGVASGGAGCWAKGAGAVGKGVGVGIKVMDIGGNVVGAAKNSYDIYENGPSVANVVGVAGNGLGLAGNINMKCFTEGTQVVVGAEYDENGVFVQYVTVNIEDVKVGDLVYSYNTLTGETELRAVQSILHRNSDHLRYIEVVDEFGVAQTFETTDAHPFWVVDADTNGRYVIPEYVEEYDPVTGQTIILFHENTVGNGFGGYICAGDLRVGDVCVGPNGELVTVVSTRRDAFPDGIAVYNFEVDGAHNYYVIANAEAFYNGASPVLVHNAVGEKCGPDFTHFPDDKRGKKQLSEVLGVDVDDLHDVKATLKAKAKANAKDCPELAKKNKLIGDNPDILVNTTTGELGFQMPRTRAQELGFKHPPNVQIGVNISDLN